MHSVMQWNASFTHFSNKSPATIGKSKYWTMNSINGWVGSNQLPHKCCNRWNDLDSIHFIQTKLRQLTLHYYVNFVFINSQKCMSQNIHFISLWIAFKRKQITFKWDSIYTNCASHFTNLHKINIGDGITLQSNEISEMWQRIAWQSSYMQCGLGCKTSNKIMH